jgi:peptide-methionine (S)-S-oxide reductase
MEKAIFGAGCFWGVEAAFQKTKGVQSTTVGYTGGAMKNPTYENVCTNITGHAEVVQIIYDEKIISYEQLLDTFWNIHDPTQLNRQGPDRGAQYRSVIFYQNDMQKIVAENSKKKQQNSGRYKKQIVTEIIKAQTFFPAEEYHQKYLEKHGNSNEDLPSLYRNEVFLVLGHHQKHDQDGYRKDCIILQFDSSHGLHLISV